MRERGRWDGGGQRVQQRSADIKRGYIIAGSATPVRMSP